MRALLALLLVVFYFASAEAAPPRLTVQDLSLMFRSGMRAAEVQQDLQRRGFQGKIDAAAEKELLEAGATREFIKPLTIFLAQEEQRHPGSNGAGPIAVGPGAPFQPASTPVKFAAPALREFMLPYEVVRTATSPDETLLAFLQSTYEAAADLAQWDRAALERTIDLSKPAA